MEKANPANNFHYNAVLQPLAQQLRNSSTKAEVCLWKYVLRAKGLANFSFRRQRPILKYIADFVCFDLMLIIEVDGLSHTVEEAPKQDTQKDEDLNLIGFTVLRFTDEDVLKHIDKVYDALWEWIQDRTLHQ